MTSWTRAALALGLTCFIAGAAAGSLLTRTTDRDVAEANARAAVLAERLEAAEAVADAALEEHRIAVRELRTLEAKRAPAIERFRAPRPVPAECDTVVREIRAEAERIIEIDSTRIAVLEADNGRLAEELSKTIDALADANRELREQARRTVKAPRRLLGILPRPELTFGYGATYSEDRLRHGPQLTLGFKVPL